MGAGGLQALVKSGLDPRDKRVVLAGSGPLLLAVGAGLVSEGAKVLGIYEQAPLARLAKFGITLLAHPRKLIEGAGYRRKTLGVPYRTGAWVVRAEGRGRVEQVTLTDGRKVWSVDCDWLGCGFHLVPNLELPRLLGCRVEGGYVAVDRLQQSSAAGRFLCGRVGRHWRTGESADRRPDCRMAAAGREVEALKLVPQRKRMQLFAARLDLAFRLRPELRALAVAKRWSAVARMCRAPLSRAAASWREAKLQTRCGMGACQGRVCGAATEFLFGWENSSSRPPVFPAAVSVLACEAHRPELAGR